MKNEQIYKSFQVGNAKCLLFSACYSGMYDYHSLSLCIYHGGSVLQKASHNNKKVCVCVYDF